MTHARVVKRISPVFSLDLDLPVSGAVALYGPPGAGKSLALETIAGFVAPDAGRILLDDVILFDAESRVNVSPRRRRVAWVGKHIALFPHMTLEENVKFAARRLPRLERHRRVAEILERFGVLACARMRPRDLLPAQALRGAVARALAGEPKLLLLDDCGLDEALLREIGLATTAPVVLVTSNLDLCCAAADTLVLLDGGRIVQSGGPREALDRPQSVDAARLLGIANLLQGTIAALDPARNTSRIDFERFSLNGLYIPGHFRGDHVWVAIDAHHLRVHSADAPAPGNTIAAQLVRASQRAHSVRLEFEGPLIAEIPREAYGRILEKQSWQVEFPVESLKIL